MLTSQESETRSLALLAISESTDMEQSYKQHIFPPKLGVNSLMRTCGRGRTAPGPVTWSVRPALSVVLTLLVRALMAINTIRWMEGTLRESNRAKIPSLRNPETHN